MPALKAGGVIISQEFAEKSTTVSLLAATVSFRAEIPSRRQNRLTLSHFLSVCVRCIKHPCLLS